METREEIIERLIQESKVEYFKTHGFIMDSHQRKVLKKQVEKMVDKRLKNINNRRFI